MKSSTKNYYHPGTTVSLLDRVAAGAFSERLFYRLNVIHVVVGDVAVMSGMLKNE